MDIMNRTLKHHWEWDSTHHDRRDRVPVRHRVEDHREEGRLRLLTERQPGLIARGCRVVRHRTEKRRTSWIRRSVERRRSMPAMAGLRLGPPPSFTTLIGYKNAMTGPP